MPVETLASTPLARRLSLDGAGLLRHVRASQGGSVRADVFRADLDALATDACVAQLSRDERARCERLHGVQRHRSAASRALVRRVLGAYVGTAPSAVPLLHTGHGKPYLADGTRDRGPIHFNVAHSDAAWMLVVSRHAPLGVDVEAATSDRFPAAIAELVLAPTERAAFATIGAAAHASFLAQRWVSKEAWLKLRGNGLAVDPAGLTLPASPRAGLRQWLCMRVDDSCWLYTWRDDPLVAAIAMTKPVDEIVDVDLRFEA